MRFFRNDSGKHRCLLAFVLIGPLLAGCWTHKKKADPHAAPIQSTADTNQAQFGPLRIGDAIKIDLTGAPNPIATIDSVIKGDGTISLDYIGGVRADGLTPGELEKLIQAKYVPAYYTHLNVTVTPMVQFFYVDGEINAGGGGGRIPYTGQITVTRAIAAAGGFNPFANRRNVRLYRVDGSIKVINCIKALEDPKLDMPVYPGDKIVVKRRLW